MLPKRMRFGIFLAPFHSPNENPTIALERDLELIQRLDELGYDEAWIGEHHSCGWETIAAPDVFIATAAERTKHIRLGTGVVPLPYHHPLIVANRMVLLDHLTRGRVALGTGPGALNSDGHMLGIDHQVARRRWAESMEAIIRLLRDENPVTMKTDWFELNEAHLQLRPYSQPHFEIAAASAQSPAGMEMCGKYGITPLSLTFARSPGGFLHNTLADLWDVAVESGERAGNNLDRENWGLVMHAFIADSREEARNIARHSSGQLQREYFERTIGMSPIDCELDGIMDKMVQDGAWCIGTPDDLIEAIHTLDENSGGFGRLILLATELGTTEQVLHSYELISRYVMPVFQGSLESLQFSQKFFGSEDVRIKLGEEREKALQLAGTDYEVSRIES